MFKPTFVATAFCAATLLALVSCGDNSAKTEAAPTAKTEISQDSRVKRGNYLVSAIGCDDCHSPKTMGPQGPQLDLDHRLSGYPSTRPVSKVNGADLKNGWMLFGGDLTSSVGPWGISFAANITSDSTGIGNWTEEQFFTSIRKGKLKGLESNRDLLPPMPWQNFSKLNDDDLKAIFAYLKSTKPVHNVVPSPKQVASL
jgi:mono/diheme cytochrome c family protein